MKKKFTSPTFKKHVERRQKSSLKEGRIHKAWLTEKRRKEQGTPKPKLQWERQTKKRKTVFPPTIFSLVKNPNEVLSFITSLKNYCHKGKEVHVSLEKVTTISHDAIAMILSVIGEFNDKNLIVSGNKPTDPVARRVLERSGFFNHVRGFIENDNRDTINSILTRGKKVVKSDETAPVVLGAMNTVWGRESRNQKLQGMLIELMANSVNHAYPTKSEVRWWLSVNHNEKNNEVSFSFVDNGIGILKKIKTKNIFQKISHIFTNNIELLEDLFSGEIGSSTKLVNRGRGLPSIYERFSDSYIRNLLVITNDVLIDFSNGKKELLNSPFDGTFYYWELNKESIKWK